MTTLSLHSYMSPIWRFFSIVTSSFPGLFSTVYRAPISRLPSFPSGKLFQRSQEKIQEYADPVMIAHIQLLAALLGRWYVSPSPRFRAGATSASTSSVKCHEFVL